MTSGASPLIEARPSSGDGSDGVVSRPGWRLVLDVFLENRLAIVALFVLAFILLFCFVGPLVYHTDQVHVNLAEASQPPSGAHLLGTDDTGRDILGRLMVGGRVSLAIGFGAAVVATLFGALWGAVAGFSSGLVDAVMMRTVDGLLAIPSLFFLLFLASVVDTTVPMLIIVVAFISWLVPARLIRGETLSLRGLDYMQAVRVMGGGRWRSIFQHVLPNTFGTIMVNLTFQVADAIITVATLSFLGLGVRPPTADWGTMLSSGADYAADGYWWMIIPPGVAIVLTVMSLNFIGDALRDGLSARLRVR